MLLLRLTLEDSLTSLPSITSTPALSPDNSRHSSCSRSNNFHRNNFEEIENILQEGKELGRVPAIHNGKVQKFFFNEEAIVTAFDLNNVYKKCKEDKKFVPFENKESKKEK